MVRGVEMRSHLANHVSKGLNLIQCQKQLPFTLLWKRSLNQLICDLKEYLQEGMINCGSVFPAYPSFVYLQNEKENYEDFTNILAIMTLFLRFPFVMKWDSTVSKYTKFYRFNAFKHPYFPKLYQNYTHSF